MIKDNTGATVASISSRHDGMGTFTFTPPLIALIMRYGRKGLFLCPPLLPTG
ncbi:hypothetical protein LWM68_12505 [Niabella sp. W65]|nr:hypothetical protein [Niabella sp. W65]MCH7363493.1 hypothetical protein [Niabella sp. W65]ULT39412.1 hypothetical protein KRR40_31300 [Niabella sp. I65]